MAYSPTAHGQRHRHEGATAYTPAKGDRVASKTSGGCGCAESERPHTCCDLVCFERPEYFCGHLLTDTDLSLDQRYVREKHKLYHRTLHGHGIVCGLRLTCDHACRGHVLIGEGYGIDDCGNDLVVCEPASFNVIGRLREKKLLYRAPPQDDCKPKKPEDDCRIRQCFYITACYDEEPQEFATPLPPSCGPSPRDCEPTRVRETVRFDVLERLPRERTPLDDLQRRIEKCFALFTTGPFAEEVKTPVVQEGAEGRAVAERHQEFCDALCRLRVLLKLYLDAHPDHYNCTLVEDLDCVACPPGRGESGFNANTYATDFRSAFCRIVDLAYGHVVGCVFGELAFPCAEPAKASCLVLGTVEVEGDRIVQVCNCPRSYVWSFTSFFQVLLATLFGRLACESVEETGHDHGSASGTHERPAEYQAGHDDRDCDCGKTYGPKTCCKKHKPLSGCAAYSKTLRDAGHAVSDVATAPLGAIRWVSAALQHAFDPTRTDVFLAGAFRGKEVGPALELLRAQKFNVRSEEAPADVVPGNPLDVLNAAFHQTVEDRLIAYHRAGHIVDVRQEPLRDRVVVLERELADLKSQLGYRPEPGDQGGPAGRVESEGGAAAKRPRGRRR
jgi:hypothetical protein